MTRVHNNSGGGPLKGAKADRAAWSKGNIEDWVLEGRRMAQPVATATWMPESGIESFSLHRPAFTPCSRVFCCQSVLRSVLEILLWTECRGTLRGEDFARCGQSFSAGGGQDAALSVSLPPRCFDRVPHALASVGDASLNYRRTCVAASANSAARFGKSLQTPTDDSPQRRVQRLVRKSLKHIYFSAPLGRNFGGKLSRQPLYFNSRVAAATRVKTARFPRPPNYFPNSLLAVLQYQAGLKKSVCLKRFRAVVCSLPN